MHETSKSVPTCRHLFADGHLCGSPAMHDKIFCYHHQRDRQRRENIRAALGVNFANGQGDADAETIASLDLPAPEDPIAVQVCLSNTFLALSSGLIPTKRAALMLYNLQIIASQFNAVAKYRESLMQAEMSECPAAETASATASERTPEGVLYPKTVGARPASPAGGTGPAPTRRRYRAVCDPEPVASVTSRHRQADFMFSEERYERELVTDEPAESVAVAQAAAEQAEAERTANYHAHPQGELPVTDIAPMDDDELHKMMDGMSEEAWEKHIRTLEISSEEHDALWEKVFSDNRKVRCDTRYRLLKYNPLAVEMRQEWLARMKPKFEALDKFHELPEDTKATG